MGCCQQFPFIGAGRGDDVLAKTKALVNPDAPNNAAPSKVIDRLYSILDIMDAKASGLLTLNSFFIAVLTGFLGFVYAPENAIQKALPTNFVPVAEFDLALLIVSSIFCLFVVRVNWKFLRNAALDGAGKFKFDNEVLRLAKVVDDRTHLYWFAWYGTLFAFLVPSALWLLF